MRLRSPLYLQNLTFFQQSTFWIMSHPNKSTILPLFPPMDRNLVSALYIERRVIGRWTRFKRRVFFSFFFRPATEIYESNGTMKGEKEETKREGGGVFTTGCSRLVTHPVANPVRQGLTWVAHWGRFPFVRTGRPSHFDIEIGFFQGFLLKTISFLLFI